MRIAQIAPIAERVPPKRYGGTERVVSALTEELVKRGHDVTLFASGDSVTSANLISVFPRGIREAGIKDPHGINEWSILNIAQAYSLQDEFDIIHDHNFPISLLSAGLSHNPVVATLHGPVTNPIKRIYSTLDRVNLVTISNSQRKHGQGLNIVETVYNGLDFEKYPFSDQSEGYLLFVGRASFDKGLHHAIDIATFLNKRLIIAAKIDKADTKYFEDYIEPRLAEGLVEWVGEVDEVERNRLYSKALCLINPITWPEPFGLTMIEAMACGCPVVAFDQGSVSELILPGVSGFIANDLEEMIESVEEVAKISRRDTVSWARANFNSSNMTNSYERVYRQILQSKKRDNRQSTATEAQFDLLLETGTYHRQKPRNH